MALRGAHKILNNTSKFQENVTITWIKLTKKSNKNYYLQYEGQSLSKKPHGFGIITKIYKNGNIEKYYNGYFVSGKKQGFGGLWNDNFYYEGDFFSNKRHGFGKIWYKDGSFYKGSWKNNLYHGEGIFKEKGNLYQGKFNQGKKHGNGIFYHLTTGQMQKGIWINDRCVESTIEDIYLRQSAIYPSSYPIPPLKH